MKNRIPSHATVVRAGKNAHRFFYFVNGKFNTLQTFKEDIQSVASDLFGFITSSNLIKSSLVLFLLTAGSAYALPQDGQSIAGNVQFQQNGNTLNISAAAARSIANYHSFSIGSNEKVNFTLPSASAAILNRVTGGEASQILGAMTSNGRVFLVNPNGVFIGQGANINVGGLFATTLNIKDADFLNNNLLFYKDPDHAPASVVNQGTINITPGGFATLVGSAVQNTGTINAPLGNIQLAVGDQVKASISDVALVDFKVTESLKSKVDGVNSAIANSGALLADGGIVKLQVDLVRNVYQQAINQEGMIRAQSVQNHNGVIELLGTSDDQNALVTNTGTLDASGYTANQAGGTVHVLGDQVSLTDNSKIDASGNAGGGQVRIGGDYQGKGDLYNAQRTFVGQNAQILNNAVNTGDGGKTIVWANDVTAFNGHISTQGGGQSGNGGFTEVSGKNGLSLTGTVDATAAHGTTGQTLLDPFNLTIVESGGTNVVSDATFANQPTTNMTINASNVNTVGATSNVLLQANNNLTFNNTITPINVGTHNLTGQAGNNLTVNGLLTANQLTLQAGNDVNINRNITGTNGVTLTSDAALQTVPNPTVPNNVGNIHLNANVTTGTSPNSFSPFLTNLSGVNITQSSGALSVDRLVVNLHGGGDATLTQAGNNARSFSANATGANTQNSTVNFTNEDTILLFNVALGDGNLILTALNGGDIDNFGIAKYDTAPIALNHLTVNLDGGGSANLQGGIGSTNDVKIFAANATGNNTQNTTVSFRGLRGITVGTSNLNHGSMVLQTNAGNITQTGAITADALGTAIRGGGDVTLTRSDNNVNTFSGATNFQYLIVPRPPVNSQNTTISFTNAHGFNVGYGNLDLGHMVLNALNGGNITQTSSITGNSLAVNLSTGFATLNNPANDLAIFSINKTGASSPTQESSYTDRNSFQVASSNLNGSNLALTALGGGSITQSGAIRANRLSVTLNGGGSATLNRADNNVAILAANATGANTQNTQFNYTDANSFAMNRSDLLNGNLSLTALGGGNITQNDAITANRLVLTLNGGGDATLNRITNNVNVFAANATGNNTQNTNVAYTDTNGFAVNRSSLTNGSLNLTALNGGNITQNEAITGNRLTVTLGGGGDATLTRSNNNVVNFAANANGANTQNTTVAYTDTNSFNVEHSVLGGGNLVLTALNGGNISQSGGLTGNSLTVNLQGGGDAEIESPGNNFNIFSANASGANTQNTLVGYFEADSYSVNRSDLHNGNLILFALEGGNLTQNGAITANNLFIIVNNGGDATLTNTGNSVRSLNVNAGGGNTQFTTISYTNNGNFNLGESTLQNATLVLRAINGGINQTGALPLGGNLRVILDNLATADFRNTANRINSFAVTGNQGGAVSLFNNGDLSLLSSHLGGSSTQQGRLSITTTGLLTIPSGSNVFANKTISLRSGDINLLGTVNLGNSSPVSRYDLSGMTLSPFLNTDPIALGVGSVGYNLSNAEFSRLSTVGPPIQIGTSTTTGNINIGQLNLSQKPSVTFNTRGDIVDATPTDSTVNIISAPSGFLTFTGGLSTGPLLGPGARQIGAPGLGDLDVQFNGTSQATVHVVGFTGSGTSFNVTTPTGGAFINVP